MPLINFRSDLTALQYGADRPGGGSSGQPYIVSPNPDNPPINTVFTDYYTGNRTGLDYPIRGGVIQQSQLVGTFTTPAGIIDRARIQAFLNDGSRGKIFLEKQKGLQLSNPNIQVPPVLRFQQGITTLDQAIIQPTRLYSETGANLLTQVGGQGTGLHVERHGETVRLIDPYQQTYEYYVSRNNTEASNRLTILRSIKLGGTGLIRRDPNDRTTFDRTLSAQFNNANKYGISPLNTQILAYSGGPGSVYGIGFTTINRATDTEVAHSRAEISNAFTLTYRQLSQQNTREGTEDWWPSLQDFRAQTGTKVFRTNYANAKAWYNPSLVGTPGRISSDKKVGYNTTQREAIDAINAQAPVIFDSYAQKPWSTSPEVNSKDIIKFTFECLSNDGVTDTTNDAIALIFRAFLTGFSDSHQAEFSSFKYMGRGETFRVYQGVDRSINFSFKIAAQTYAEMKPLYRKLNHLISQVYPDYSTRGLMRGSVIKLTIGDYLYRVPGFLENVNITVADDYPWEIALDQDPTILGKKRRGRSATTTATTTPQQTLDQVYYATIEAETTIDPTRVNGLPGGAVVIKQKANTGNNLVVNTSGYVIGRIIPLNIDPDPTKIIYRYEQLSTSTEVVIGGSTGVPLRETPQQLPQILDIQCSFKPIHDFLPRRETIKNRYVPFIGDGGGWIGNVAFVQPTKDQIQQQASNEALESAEIRANFYGEEEGG